MTSLLPSQSEGPLEDYYYDASLTPMPDDAVSQHFT